MLGVPLARDLTYARRETRVSRLAFPRIVKPFADMYVSSRIPNSGIQRI